MLRERLPGYRFEIVDRTENVLNGIQQTRMALAGNVYMDEQNCADGIAALDNYRKRFNSTTESYTDEPLHDRYSNYADAIRQWAQGHRLSPAGGFLNKRRSSANWRRT